MKRFIVIITCLCLMLCSCGTQSRDSNYAKNKEITLDLSYGQRTGKYTGPLNELGLPEGQGSFTATNPNGTKWTYTGFFVNGHFEGEGETKWDNSTTIPQRGTYHDDVLQPLDASILSNVYMHTDDYIGNCIEIYGKVYNVTTQDGVAIIQLYQDIENSGNNTLVISNSTNGVKAFDYVKVKGIVDGKNEYENLLGNKVTALELMASEITPSSYIEAVMPTIKSVDVNETQSQYGYSVTVEKVEFARNETRIYLTVENGGSSNFSLYEWNTVAAQNGTQFEYQHNWDADYPKIASDLRPGNTAKGIIVFPPLAQEDFQLYVNGGSDDFWNEHFEELTFTIHVD